MQFSDSLKTCELCKRTVNTLTKHHLTPKSRGGSKSDVVLVCLSCKDMVHKLIPNKQLEREYNSISKLLKNEKVRNYVKWIRNRELEQIPMANKKRKI